MALEIERREKDGVVILAPRGRLVLGEAVEGLRAAIDLLIREGKARVALDLSHAAYIDSTALGCLVMAHTRFTRAGGMMPLFGLNGKIAELLVITKLATVFQMAGNEVEAVNLCYPGRAARTFDVLEFVRQQRAGGEGGGEP